MSTQRAKPHVFVVDDDAAMCEAISALLRSVGMQVNTFVSTSSFLRVAAVTPPNCVILDVRLQGESGLDIPRLMERAGIYSPVLFMSGHGDVPMSVAAMKTGALDFLVKPFRDQDLLDAVAASIREGERQHELRCELEMLRANYATLSAREREVMNYAASGLMNKQIASLLGLSEVTVKIHRGKLMNKMRARNFAQLVKMDVKLASVDPR
jgi:FixJ family two-component response regulator